MKKQRLLINATLCALLASAFNMAHAQPATETSVRASAAPDLLLAKELPAHVQVADYLISEKYDGVRAYWDGAVLRFRGGGVVHAPTWFTERLPRTPLDGELWLGRGQFETTSGIVRQSQPNDADWRRVRYMIFELPNAAGSFELRAAQIQTIVTQASNPQLIAVPQYRLNSRAALQNKLNEITRAGGEGLMLHLASAEYETGRSDVLYKLKARQDAEAVVIAHMDGQGKYAGQLGALRVRTSDGREFNLGTGLTDVQRAAPPAIGDTVTYQYNGLTKNGLPRFARFLRTRDAP